MSRSPVPRPERLPATAPLSRTILATGFTVPLKTVELALFDLHKVKPEHFDAWRTRLSGGSLVRNPSSAIRLFVLHHFKARAAGVGFESATERL